MDNSTSIFGLLQTQRQRLNQNSRIASAAKDSLWILQRLSFSHSLDNHRGCVNSVAWNESGSLLLSGSDDHRLIVAEPHTKRVRADILTRHRANIFSAKFLPASCDNRVVSCAGDGSILYTDVEHSSDTSDCFFNCHSGTTYEVLQVPADPHTFLTCGEDGTVRWFDLRLKEKCNKPACKEDVLVWSRCPVTSISLNPVMPYHLAVGTSDSSVRIYDRRMLGTRGTGHGEDAAAVSLEAMFSRFTVPAIQGKNRRITSLDFRPDGRELLVSYSSDHIYILDPLMDDPSRSKRLFVGRSSSRAKSSSERGGERSPPPVKRLRLRGDWSDTGPNARPESEAAASNAQQEAEGGAQDQGNHANLMQRMTDALSRMLNDPTTRLAMRSAQARQRSQSNPERDQPDDPDPAGVQNEQQEQIQDTSQSPQANQVDQNPVAEPDQEVEQNQQPPDVFQGTEETPDLAALGEAERDRHSDIPASQMEPADSSPPDNLEERNISDEDDASSERAMDVVEDSAADSSSPTSMRQTMSRLSSIRQSIASLREDFIERHHREPELSLRYSSVSVESSTISMETSPRRRSEADSVPVEDHQDLPGPSTVVTDPGNTSRNPITGQRQRRIGVSGPPSGPSLDCPSSPLLQYRAASNEVYEFEEDMDEGDEDEEGASLKSSKAILQPPVLQTCSGHRNARTMIKEASWWGNSFILSGSDCGHVFGWERATGKLVMLLEADRHVVNCVQPHPFDPVLATSGIDYNVKLWQPLKEQPEFDEQMAEVLSKRNELMLEETRDTITVPATLMIRMLASLNQLRRGRVLPREEPGAAEHVPPREEAEPDDPSNN